MSTNYCVAPKRARSLILAGLSAVVLFSGLAPMSVSTAEESQRVFITNFNRPKSVPATVTERVTDASKATPMLSPQSQAQLEIALSRYEQIAQAGGWPELKLKRWLMLGWKGKDVELLRQRLIIQGYLPETSAQGEKFDKELDAAIREFQTHHGLLPNGQVTAQTLAELNVPVEARIEQIRANLPRVKKYSEGIEGHRYIIVNIPATQLEVVNADGSVFSRHNIIAGKPSRPSPIVNTRLSDINFNPYWNAPVSIVERDIIPSILKDRFTLQKMNMKVFDGYGGPEVDPSRIDWRNTPAGRYFFRQEPGPNNAMATVKINFPSPFGVYMHDTPSKFLFDQAVRYESSGCVRVDDVHMLVNWILDDQDQWNRDRIEDISKKVERVDVKLENDTELRWVYLTAWAMPDGKVNFRPDIYELDGTGFVTGQPMPVGEFAEDGRRWFENQPRTPIVEAPEKLELPADPVAEDITATDAVQAPTLGATPQGQMGTTSPDASLPEGNAELTPLSATKLVLGKKP